MADSENDGLHQCVDCGFLSLMRGKAGLLTEVSDIARHAYLFDDAQPWCFMRKRFITQDYLDLKLKAGIVAGVAKQGINLDAINPEELGFVRKIKEQIAANQTLNEDTAIYEMVLTKPIDCSEFTEYKQGFSPKEHREMLDRQQMLEREHEWRENEQAAQKEILGIARDTAKSSRYAAWAQAGSVIVAAIAIAVSVIVSQCNGGTTTTNYYGPTPPSATVSP